MAAQTHRSALWKMGALYVPHAVQHDSLTAKEVPLLRRMKKDDCRESCIVDRFLSTRAFGATVYVIFLLTALF